MRNRIAHQYWTVDYDNVWAVVAEHAPQLHHELAEEISIARAMLEKRDQQ